MLNRISTVVLGVLLVGGLWGRPAFAQDYLSALQELASGEISGIASDPDVVAAINAANVEHANLTDSDIDALDKKWREEVNVGGGDMIGAVSGNSLSHHLAALCEKSGGKIVELIVMDNKGLNVGISSVTSDYMQGDEAKWQKTYQAGSDDPLFEDVKQDESTGVYVSQVSVVVKDPATNERIGALTASVNVETLE